MSQKSSTPAPKAPAERVVRDIRRATRKQYSAEGKIRIALEGLRGADAAYNQGVILWNAGKIAEAKTQFEASVKADPNYADEHTDPKAESSAAAVTGPHTGSHHGSDGAA